MENNLNADLSGPLDQFDHVVVLMLENRSFDNLLGYLYSPLDAAYPNGIPATAPLGKTIEGVYGKNLSNPVPAGTPNPPPGGATTIQVRPQTNPNSNSPYPDPGETYDHVNTQLFNQPNGHDKPPYNLPNPVPATPGMQGFVNDYIYNYQSFEFKGTNPTYDQYAQIMDCYTPAAMPVLSKLAQEFAVFDHWFCAVPSQTWCNRAFWNAGTSWGRVVNGPSFKWTSGSAGSTIFNQISQSGLFSGLYWKVYTPDIMPVSLTTAIHQLALAPFHAPPFKNFWGMTRFFIDCRLGTLPAYSFVEPMFLWPHNDMHPSSTPPSAFGKDAQGEVKLGDDLVWQVYDAIRRSPKADKTLLIITFDEHGGCYDHVPPPAVVAPDLKGYELEDGFDFTRLGVRVPMIMVSSHIAKNTVVNAQMDHCSFMKTMSMKWNKIAPGKFPPLTARVAAAPDFTQVFTSPTLRPAATSWPVITRPSISQAFLKTDFSNFPLGHLDKSIIHSVEGLPQGVEAHHKGFVRKSPTEIHTVGEAFEYLNSVPGLRPPDNDPARLMQVADGMDDHISKHLLSNNLSTLNVSTMADSSNIPLTIVTTTIPPVNINKQPYFDFCKIKIGKNLYQPSTIGLKQGSPYYWALVIDRTSANLSVVQNFIFTDNNNVPSQLSQYDNNPNYLLILTTYYLSTPMIPAGAFYTFLTSQMNAGPALGRIEQIFGAMYSSNYQYMGYTIVAPFDGSVEQAIEYSETDGNISTYTLQLVPTQNPDGTTVYVPYPLY
ncbi:MAG: alkaline phosphatase family protein [Ferruginibacter sp.]